MSSFARIGVVLALAAAAALFLAPPNGAQKPSESDSSFGVRRFVRPEQPNIAGMRERWAASDLVILGRVVDERAELAADKSTVWTHYTLEVLQVFKHAGSGPEPKSLAITVEGGNVADGENVLSVVNEVFPALPWVREHVFFLRQNEDGSYRPLGGAQGVFRHDAQGLMRCHLPKPSWDFLCRSRDGSKWEDLIKDIKTKY